MIATKHQHHNHTVKTWSLHPSLGTEAGTKVIHIRPAIMACLKRWVADLGNGHGPCQDWDQGPQEGLPVHTYFSKGLISMPQAQWLCNLLRKSIKPISAALPSWVVAATCLVDRHFCLRFLITTVWGHGLMKRAEGIKWHVHVLQIRLQNPKSIGTLTRVVGSVKAIQDFGQAWCIFQLLLADPFKGWLDTTHGGNEGSDKSGELLLVHHIAAWDRDHEFATEYGATESTHVLASLHMLDHLLCHCTAPPKDKADYRLASADAASSIFEAHHSVRILFWGLDILGLWNFHESLVNCLWRLASPVYD